MIREEHIGNRLMRNIYQNIFFFYVVFCGINLFSQNPAGQVNIFVSSEIDNKPVMDWVLIITSKSFTKKIKVNSVSEYSIKSLPIDIYTVRIVKTGYHILEYTNVKVLENQITGIGFKLKIRKSSEKRHIYCETFKTLKIIPNNTSEQ